MSKTLLSVLSLCALLLAVAPAARAAEVVHQEAAVEINGAKFWLPSTLVVKKGDTVKIHAVSKLVDKEGKAAPHGFEIADFKVSEVIDDKGKDIEFKADKAGIFPIRCQLHPAHIGGQLVVLE